MKLRAWVLPVLAALVFPAMLSAQEGRGGGGWLGILFGWEADDAREARVARVVDGSPAERAGVRMNDVVVAIDGDPASEETVDRMRERLRPGTRVELRIRRDGREETRTVVAGERPEENETEDVIVLREGLRIPGREGGIIIRGDSVIELRLDSLMTRMDSLRTRLSLLRPDSGARVFRYHGGPDSVIVSVPRLPGNGERVRVFGGEGFGPESPFYMELGRRTVAGAELAEMNEGLGRYFRTDEGLLVLRVSPSTPASRAGLEAGDVIVAVGDEAVESVDDLRGAFARTRDGRLQLTVLREGRRREVELQWDRPEVRPVPGVRYQVQERERARTR